MSVRWLVRPVCGMSAQTSSSPRSRPGIAYLALALSIAAASPVASRLLAHHGHCRVAALELLHQIAGLALLARVVDGRRGELMLTATTAWCPPSRPERALIEEPGMSLPWSTSVPYGMSRSSRGRTHS